MKRTIALILALMLAVCGFSALAEASEPLADGVYNAEFTTDSSMFHVNEVYDNIGTLTVQDGQMTIHVVLAGKGIVNLFPGLAEDAQKEGAVLLEPTEETVNYADGTTGTAYAFDIPRARHRRGVRLRPDRQEGQVVRPQGHGQQPRAG